MADKTVGGRLPGATGLLPRAGSCPACGAIVSADGGSRRRPAHATSVPSALPSPIAAAALSASELTARERDVLQLLGFGYDNRSIARELTISERTVKRHVTEILAKLNLESRLQAGLAALVISSVFILDSEWPEGLIDLPRVPGRHCNYSCRRYNATVNTLRRIQPIEGQRFPW